VGEIAVLLKIGNDLLDSALGESAPRGDVTDTVPGSSAIEASTRA
jgi:hypothetical protein